MRPYTLDKFESRADLCCRALLEARARLLAAGIGSTPALFPEAAGSAVRVSSVGGGPGNDAVGYLLFSALVAADTAPPQTAVTVYDFCPEWGETVDAVAAALPSALGGIAIEDDETAAHSSGEVAKGGEMRLGFELCDLRQPPSAAVNGRVVAAAPGVDLTICSFCCHESGAASVAPPSANLLRALLCKARLGSALLVLDLWKQCVEEVAELVRAVGGFALYPLGSSQHFPFKGFVAVRLSVPE